jgi:acyl carrier protein
MEEVKEQIRQLLIEEFEVDPNALQPEAQLGDDLGIDSLDAVDLVVMVEKRFDCRIDEERASQMQTLGDIYAYVETMRRTGSSDERA